VNIPDVLFIVALVLGAIELVRSRGQALVAWAVVLIAAGLLYGLVVK